MKELKLKERPKKKLLDLRLRRQRKKLLLPQIKQKQ
jgi:hypothetical protein